LDFENLITPKISCVAEEVNRVGVRGLGDTIMVDVETLLDAFFGGVRPWDYFPRVPDYQQPG